MRCHVSRVLYTGWGDDNPVTRHLASAWLLLQPLLFSLIGAEVDTDKLDTQLLGLAAAVICAGLVIRLPVSQAAVLGGELSPRERVFVSLAWLPKATVQAAIGPIALDQAKQLLAATQPGLDCAQLTAGAGNSTAAVEACAMLGHGNTVLTVAVMAILITAPLGAVAIIMSGPRLLTASRSRGYEEQEEEGE